MLLRDKNQAEYLYKEAKLAYDLVNGQMSQKMKLNEELMLKIEEKESKNSDEKASNKTLELKIQYLER